MDKKYREIAKRYGTPYYLFSIQEICNRIIEVKNILGSDVRLCYAVKANPFCFRI